MGLQWGYTFQAASQILQSIPDELRVDIVECGRHDISSYDGVSARGSLGTCHNALLSCHPEGGCDFDRGRSAAPPMGTMAYAPDAASSSGAGHHTLLVKGLDTLTQKALATHPSSLFRLATFRERLGIDYAPTL